MLIFRKHHEFEMKNDVKRYVNSVCRKLYLPAKIKKDIKANLTSEIYLRIENGENLNEVLTSIGSPKDVAKSFNKGYENEYQYLKGYKILALIILSVLCISMFLLILYYSIALIYPQIIPPVIIGGASGNTSAFLAYKWGMQNIIIRLLIALVILFFSLFGIFFIYKSTKNKSNN